MAARDRIRRLSIEKPSEFIRAPQTPGTHVLSTPLRIGKQSSGQTTTPGPGDTTTKGSSNFLVTATKRTPAQFRWPLLTYLRQRGHQKHVIDAAKRIPNGIQQQRIFNQIVDFEDHFDETKHKIPEADLAVINELRRQFVLSAIQHPDGHATTNALKECINQSISSIIAKRAREGPSDIDVEEEDDDDDNSRCIEGEAIPTFSQCDDSPYIQPSSTPMTSEGLQALPSIEGTPGTFGKTTSPGDTPLDRIKRNAIDRTRVAFLKRMSQALATPIKLDAQRRLSAVPESETRASSICSGKRPAPKEATSALKKRRTTLDASISDSTTASIPEVSVFPEENEGKKRPGSCALLGVKANQQGKRYVSRVARNAKMAATKERKKLREGRDGMTADQEKPARNDTYRERKSRQIERLQNARVLPANGLPSDDVVQHMRTKFESAVRQRLADICRESHTSLIAEYFGLTTLRDSQTRAIDKLIESSPCSLMLSLPTGYGKSLVFQFAGAVRALLHNELTIVICPTTSLLSDQQSRFEQMDREALGRLKQEDSEDVGGILNIGVVHSGLEMGVIRGTLKAISAGLVDVLFVTPEQFTSWRLQWTLKAGTARTIDIVTIDEAHCVSEWAHSFRPAYQGVIQQALRSSNKLLMLTGTATKSTLDSIGDYVGDSLEIVKPADGGYRRDDLELKILGPVQNDDEGRKHHRMLSDLLKKAAIQYRNGTILVFVWMKYQAVQVAELLRSEFPNELVLYYHSGLDEEEKTRVQGNFGRCRFLVATQALGLGIDVANITAVFHANMPASIEQYLQEIGRCNRGRQQESITCSTILNPSDYRARAQQISGSRIDRTAMALTFHKLFKFPTSEKLDAGKGEVLIDLSQVSRLTVAKKSNILVLYNTEQTVRMKHKTEDTAEEMAAYPCVLSVSTDYLARMMNFRGEDDVKVFLTLFKHHCENEFDEWEDVEEEEKSEAEVGWNGLIEWWLSRTQGSSSSSGHRRHHQPIQVHDCQGSVGLEIRLFKTDLKTLIEENPVFKYLKSLIKLQESASSPVLKVVWTDILLDRAQRSLRTFMNLGLLEQMIYDCSEEFGYSVRSIADRRVTITLLRPKDELHTSRWTTLVQTLMDSSVLPLDRNARVQRNRLNATYVAMKLGTETDPSCSTEEFIDQYFEWNRQLEQRDSSDLWNNVPQVPNANAWLKQPFSTCESEVECANLRFDIVQLLKSHSTTPAEQVEDLQSLERPTGAPTKWITPMTIARILCGIRSLSHNYENGGLLWKKYAGTEFDVVLDMCYKVFTRNETTLTN